MVVVLRKLKDTVKIQDGSTDNNLVEVDNGGRVSTNLFASPDSGSTILRVRCDEEGNIGTTGNLIITGAISNFLTEQTILTGVTTSFTLFTVPSGKQYIITDYGVTSIDYAGVGMTLLKNSGLGDVIVLRSKQTSTAYQIRESFAGGIIFNQGEAIKIQITNTTGSTAEYDLFMTGKEVDA